jgi:DNA-binding NarL/FixJ family response regulator
VIRLLIVDDQQLICQGLTAMLAIEPDLEIIGTAENGEAALAFLDRCLNEAGDPGLPDVILMDVRMPIMDGRVATQLIHQRFPQVKILVLSTFDDDLYVSDSMRAGAQGYLLKDMPAEELVQAIRFVHRGYYQLGPGLMEKLIVNPPVSASTPLVDQPLVDQPVLAELPQLTPREQEVLRLIGLQGATNRDIAEQLYISEGTVKTHVNHLLNRLNLRNRSQLAIYAHAHCSRL